VQIEGIFVTTLPFKSIKVLKKQPLNNTLLNFEGVGVGGGRKLGALFFRIKRSNIWYILFNFNM